VTRALKFATECRHDIDRTPTELLSRLGSSLGGMECERGVPVVSAGLMASAAKAGQTDWSQRALLMRHIDVGTDTKSEPISVSLLKSGRRVTPRPREY
jgi:hypothetical protein